MSCSLFYSVDLRREQPGLFLIMKSRVLNIKKNKKKAICYGILVLWYIDAIIFKKEK